MRRYKLIASLVLLSLVLLGAGGVLMLLLRHEKSFYLRLAPPAGPERERDSNRCLNKLADVTARIIDRNPDLWEARFTEKELNSYFAEDFERKGMSDQLLPDDVSEPRVALDGDGVVRLGFRYGKRPWQTVITITFRIWLAKDEPNTICLELLGTHAGGLPISAQGILERVFNVARRQGIEVAWYNYNGHQTAVLRFQTGQNHQAVTLRTLTVQNGEIIIGGQGAEGSPQRAWLGPREHGPDDVTD
jgi:hypothetical protein